MSTTKFETKTCRIRDVLVETPFGPFTLYRFDTKVAKHHTPARFGAPFRLRVTYEHLLPELPEDSCGVAAAFTRAGDKEPVMYFNTSYPHSDEELLHYQDAAFRKPILRRGVVEGHIPELQVSPGDYLMTVGILPNTPTHHEFYELHYLEYPISVAEGDHEVKGAFYPKVSFKSTDITELAALARAMDLPEVYRAITDVAESRPAGRPPRTEDPRDN